MPGKYLTINNLIDQGTGETNRAIFKGLCRRRAIDRLRHALAPRASCLHSLLPEPLGPDELRLAPAPRPAGGDHDDDALRQAARRRSPIGLLRDGPMPIQTKKVPARYLLRGDQVGSGETVIGVGVGARTPAGKVEVALEKDGRRRLSIWGASTVITVKREAV